MLFDVLERYFAYFAQKVVPHTFEQNQTAVENAFANVGNIFTSLSLSVYLKLEEMLGKKLKINKKNK